MQFDELPDMEKLAYMQEAYNRLGRELKVNGDGIRGRLDRRFVEDYADPDKRTKQREIVVNGVKVGTYSLSVSEAKPSYVTKEFVVDDIERLRENDDFDFRAWVARWTENNIGELARMYFEEVGEIPDGCDYVDVSHPETPMSIGSTRVRIDHRKFDEAMGANLSTAIAGYLEESK